MNNKDLNRNISLFFVDLDGTLVDQKNDGVSDFNREAITNFTSITGNKVVISTGRIGGGAIPFMDEFNSDYIIMGNGSLIMNKNKEIVFEKRLDIESIKKILEFASKNKLAYKIDGMQVCFNCVKIFPRIFAKKFGYGINEDAANPGEILYKIVLFGKTVRRMKRIQNKLDAILGKNCSVVTSFGGFTIEITNSEATKGIANEYVWKELYKITNIAKTAHIGDSMNDSTAKGKIGTLYALKNSSKQLLKMCDVIGPHYKNHAVGIIIKANTRLLN